MQQIADWLQKLGLGQYAQRFAENDITFLILSDLTDLKSDAFSGCFSRARVSACTIRWASCDENFG